MGTTAYRFRVPKENPQFQPHDNVLPMPVLEWEDITEILSDENIRRFTKLDEITQGILYHNWWHSKKDQMEFDAWLTKSQ
jgi:hypothetical protein